MRPRGNGPSELRQIGQAKLVQPKTHRRPQPTDLDHTILVRRGIHRPELDESQWRTATDPPVCRLQMAFQSAIVNRQRTGGLIQTL
jgi:hypothetical protein